jgi:hypothetical protein
MQGYRKRILILLALPLAGVLLAFGSPARAQNEPSSNPQGNPQAAQNDAPLTDEQVRALASRVLQNQHQNDRLMNLFERTEHNQASGTGQGAEHKDTLARVVPTGTGEARVELQRSGKPTDAAVREQQWHNVTQALVTNSRTDDPEVKKEYARAEKRRHERDEFADAAGKAFRYHYAGRETIGGRKLVKVTFDPDPSFHTSIRFASICAHIRGTAWVDEANAQIVRVEAEMFDDYSIVGGLLAKVYRGSRLNAEQAEIEPGVWLPIHTSYNVLARKLVFGVTMHEQMDYSDYRRVGAPREALLAISNEHAPQAVEDVKTQRQRSSLP